MPTLKTSLGVAGWILALIVFLFGSGFLMKPKLSISCGAIDYKIPYQYQMELMTWKMMMIAPDLEKELINKINSLLKEYGLTADKVKIIMERLTKKDKTSEANLKSLKLTPSEQNIVKSVVAKASAEVLPETMMKSLELPDAALMFEINNTGFTSARNAHIVVNLDGTAYSVTKNDENKLKESVEKGSVLSFDYDQIAPKSKVKVVVTYSHVAMPDSKFDKSLITVTCENAGTVRQKYSEDDFYISKQRPE